MKINKINYNLFLLFQTLSITLSLAFAQFAFSVDSNLLSDFSISLNQLKKIYKPTEPKKFKAKKSQTESFLSIHAMKQNLINCYQEGVGHCPVGSVWKKIFKKNPEIKAIVDKAMDREKKYKNTHFVFYHAYKSLLRVLYDFNTQMCLLEGKCDPNHPFIVLRNFGGKSKKITIDGKKYSYFKLPDINTWMDQKKKEKELIFKWGSFDGNKDIQAFLLSLNLSLYGGFHNRYVHTFYYFLDSYSLIPPKIDQILDESLKNYIKDSSKRKKFVDELTLLTKPDPSGATLFNNKDRGDLIQIFIPIDLVDKLTYLAKPWGVFWYDYITKTATRDIYDTIRQRYIAISPILKIYVNNPHRFDRNYQDIMHLINPTKLIDAFQARLLLRGEYFADTTLSKPQNIRMYRYSTMKKDEEQKYLAKLKDICSRIFAEKDV